MSGKEAVLVPTGASGKSFSATWALRHLTRDSYRLVPKMEAALMVLRAFTNIATAEVLPQPDDPPPCKS